MEGEKDEHVMTAWPVSGQWLQEQEGMKLEAPRKAGGTGGVGCERLSLSQWGRGQVGHGHDGSWPPAWDEPCLCVSRLHTHACVGSCLRALTASRGRGRTRCRVSVTETYGSDGCGEQPAPHPRQKRAPLCSLYPFPGCNHHGRGRFHATGAEP